MAVRRTPHEVADIIDRFINRTGRRWDWDEFISLRIEDPALDAIRIRCNDLHEEDPYPAQWCGPQGIETMRGFIATLRADKQDNLKKALNAGNLWRAKEILSGRIGSCRFDPDLYESFGIVLLRMGDDVQAGRFLFLSGRRRPEYQAVIDLFLRKHTRSGPGHLFATFPAQIRRRPWYELPSQVQHELEAIGFAPRAGQDALWAKTRNHKNISSVGCVIGLLVLVGLGLVIAIVAIRVLYPSVR